MAEVTIRPSRNGPLIIEGPVELFDTEGNKVTVDKPRIALCRCGASSNNLFVMARIARSDFKQLRQLILKVPSKPPHNTEPLAVANGCWHSIKSGRCYVFHADLEEKQ